MDDDRCVELWVASFNEEVISVLVANTAGTTPKNKVASTEIPRQKSKTGAFVVMPSVRGKLPGSNVRKSLTPTVARHKPASPPAPARRTLSVSNWLICLARLAPRDARTAISRLRAKHCERYRLATFAHAITRMTPAAPNMSHSMNRTSPTVVVEIVSTVTPVEELVAG